MRIRFIGTNHNGVFISDDNGTSWQNTGGNLFGVSGIEKRDSVIYASTLGGGVYAYDANSDTWFPLNDSLPTYSVNVYAIVSTSNDLLIAAGANGTCYHFDFTSNQWNEFFYYGFLLPGLLINNMIDNSDTVFAVDGNRIIRSDDARFNWVDDKPGTHDGNDRKIYSGTTNYYTITNLLTGGTWIQERNKSSAPGTTWAMNEELFAGGFFQ